jgi:hypothetical protein
VYDPNDPYINDYDFDDGMLNSLAAIEFTHVNPNTDNTVITLADW